MIQLTPHETLKHYVEMLLQSDTNSLVIKGSAGLGKTHTVLETLTEEGLEEGVHFIYITGFITPLELFNTLNKCSVLDEPKLFVFDDLEGIINNKLSVGLLKSALWEARGRRMVSYQSSTSKLEVPKTFEFDGKVVLIVNSMKEENALGKSLLDRGIHYNMNLNAQELTMYIEGILDKFEPELSTETRREVWDKIKRWSVSANFSLRSVSRAFQFYKYSKENWLDLFLNTLNIPQEQKVFYSLLHKDIPEKEKYKLFSERTGLTDKTFRNYKSKLTR